MSCPFGESSDRSIMDALGFDLEGCSQEFLPTLLYRCRTELITDTKNYDICDLDFDFYPFSVLFPFLKKGIDIPKSFYLIDYLQIFSAFGLFPAHLVTVAIEEAQHQMIDGVLPKGEEEKEERQIVSPSFLEGYNHFIYSFSDPYPEEAFERRKVSLKIPFSLAGPVLSFYEFTKTPTDYFINYSISLLVPRFLDISKDGNFLIRFNDIIPMRMKSMWLFSSGRKENSENLESAEE